LTQTQIDPNADVLVPSLWVTVVGGSARIFGQKYSVDSDLLKKEARSALKLSLSKYRAIKNNYVGHRICTELK